jgi:hypothetical protein
MCFTEMLAMKPASTFLIILLLLITFPIWIGIAGGLVGVAAGLFGAFFGILGGILGAIFGIFGAVFGLIGKLLGWIFGGMFSWHVIPAVHLPGPVVIALIILAIVLLTRSRKSEVKK